jgi:beta-ribofuranosylaminobenzene 5'-phosphate synthase
MEGSKLKVYIKTPARLHLGLIDLNGNLGRLFGGLGVGIDRPNVILEAETSKNHSITGQETDLVASLTKRFFGKYHTATNVSVNVKEAIPAHMGLGSGTQLALAVATALTRLSDIEASTPELALAMGRAERTGVGTAIFEKGGFVVDGGKIAQSGICLTEKFPPLIFREPFPLDWHFVIAVPNVQKGLASSAETSTFGKLPPMPAEDVGRVCRLTMLKLLPSLVECSLNDFGDALTDIQNIIGDYFARVQGGRYSSQASAECIEFMQKLGVHGVGQSSWGPALYGVVKKEDAPKTRSAVQIYLSKGVGGEVFIAKPNNTGARIKITNRQKDKP